MAGNTIIQVIPRKKKLINPPRLIVGLTNAVRDTVVEGRTYAAYYPPQRLTKTRYKRTGTLGRSWSFGVRVRPGQIEGDVGSNANIAPYNRRVQGARGQQDPMFRRAGWRNVDDLIKFVRPHFLKRVRLAVRQLS